MKHRYERRKPKLRQKFEMGGQLPVESILSIGTGIANQLAVNSLQTENTPVTVPTKRRDYKSFLGSVQRGLDKNYREGMLALGNNALDGELGKAKLLSAKLGAGSQASIQDAMQQEQFEGGQDVRQDRANAFNAQTINSMNESNILRRNQKVGARASAFNAFAQEQADINGLNTQMDYDTQALLLKAIESSDTQVLERAAKQFGYTDVNAFITDFMNRKLQTSKQ